MLQRTAVYTLDNEMQYNVMIVMMPIKRKLCRHGVGVQTKERDCPYSSLTQFLFCF